MAEKGTEIMEVKIYAEIYALHHGTPRNGEVRHLQDDLENAQEVLGDMPEFRLVIGQSSDEFAAEGWDVLDHPAPDRVKRGCE